MILHKGSSILSEYEYKSKSKSVGFQKTKLNTNLDYDKKTPQRLYRFEEELERLKSRTAVSSSSSTTLYMPPATSSVSFMKARDPLMATSDSKQFSVQKPMRPPLSIPVTSVSQSSITPPSAQSTLGYKKATTLANLPVGTTGTVHSAAVTTPLISQPSASGSLSFSITTLSQHSSTSQAFTTSAFSQSVKPISTPPIAPVTVSL